MNKSLQKISVVLVRIRRGPTMAVIASNCPELRINVVDINEDRIKAWNSEDFSKLPVFEPGLENIKKNKEG